VCVVLWCRAACNDATAAGRPVLNRRAGSEAGHDSNSIARMLRAQGVMSVNCTPVTWQAGTGYIG
jgi:hypothetical protein